MSYVPYLLLPLLLAIPLVLLPILLGGARIWFQAWVMGLFCLGCMVWIWTGSKECMRLPAGWVVAGLGVVACVPIVQVLPLPMSVLEVFSPERQVWLQWVVDILEVKPYWTSLPTLRSRPGLGLCGGCFWPFWSGWACARCRGRKIRAGFSGSCSSWPWWRPPAACFRSLCPRQVFCGLGSKLMKAAPGARL